MPGDNFTPSPLPVEPPVLDTLVLLHRARVSLLWARWSKQQFEKYDDACTHVAGLHPDLDADMASVAKTYYMCAMAYRYQARQALVLAEKLYGKWWLKGYKHLWAAKELFGRDFTSWPDYRSVFPRDADDIWAVTYA
jgi:hypothetical protein